MPSGSGKFDLSDCSIVIPLYADSAERLEHIHFLCEYIRRNYINYRLIIIEQGSEKKLHLPLDSRIQVEFIKKEPPFSVSEICNRGASFVKTPYFCKCDADAFFHPKSIYDALELLKNQPRNSFVFPFNGTVLDIADGLRKKVLESYEWRDFPFFTRFQSNNISIPDLKLHIQNSFGLIHLFRTEVFKRFGGYNEEFIGWGYEDDEIVYRFQILGHPRVYLENYNAFHFMHPRNATDGIQVFKNFCRMQVIRNASSEELCRAVMRWNRFS